jgi:hypothetical protein
LKLLLQDCAFADAPAPDPPAAAAAAEELGVSEQRFLDNYVQHVYCNQAEKQQFSAALLHMFVLQQQAADWLLYLATHCVCDIAFRC